MLHRKRQRKMVNPPLRAICRALNRSFSLSCSSSPLSIPHPLSHSLSERRGRSLNRARTQTRAQIFRCRFNPACMTNRECFCAPFRLPVRFFSIFPLLLPRPQLCSVATLSTGVRKKLLRVDRFAKAIATTVTFIPIERYYHIHYRNIDIISRLRNCHTAASVFRLMHGEIGEKIHHADARTMLLIFLTSFFLTLFVIMLITN